MSCTDHLTELDSLRAQVADLSRALAERAQSLQVQNLHPEGKIQDSREQSIRALHELASMSERTFEERIEQLLQLGCRRFNLPIGLVTRLRDEQLELLHVWAPGTTLEKGQLLSLQTSFCSVTLQAEEPVRFEHAALSEWRNHPAYAQLGFECYLGTKLTGEKQLYGTICFLGVEARLERFNEAETDFLRLMARWLSGELDRQAALDALRQSEERYRTLYDETPSMYFTVDSKGVTRSVNQYGAQYLGYAVEELVGQPVLNIFLEEDRTLVQAHMQDFFRHRQEVTQWEFRKVRADGTVLWVQEVVRIIEDHSGEPLALIVCEDITERKRMEEALRASEERFRTTFEMAAEGMYLCDLDGRIRQANPAFCQVIGYSEPELLDLDFQSIIHPEDLRIILPRVGQLVQGEVASLFIEKRHRHKDDSFIWAHASVSVLRDHAGHPKQLLVIVLDISARKRSEEALRQREQELRTVLDALPVGVWSTDAAGKVLLANPAGRRIWEGVAMIGSDQGTDQAMWWEQVWPSAEPHRWALAHALTRGVSSLNETLEIECRDGSHKTIRNSALPVRGDDGNVIGAIVLNEDITVQVRAEQALRQNHALLSAIMDTAIDIIYVKDTEGRYVHMNRAGARAIGMTVEQVVGWQDLALLPPDLAAASRATDRQVMETGNTVTVEETATVDEKVSTYLTIKSPYRDPEGRIIGVIGVSRDITERKQAEQTLQESEERYRLLVDEAPIGIFLNEEGRFTYVNREMLRILKAERAEDLIGTPVFERIAPEFSQIVRERIQVLVSEHKTVSQLDEEFLCLDGSRVDVAVTAIPAPFDGSPAIQVLVLDITERKRALAALQKSHAFIRQIIDTDPNFIFAKDRAGRFTLVNKAVAEAYGTTVEKLIGKTNADFNASCDEVNFFHQKDMEVLDTLQERFIPEESITDSMGKVRWLQTVKRPLLDEEGRATMVLGASTDITERKIMEETLRRRESDLRVALDERERISQDLHDGILQSLFAVGLTLEAAKSKMVAGKRKTSGPSVDQAIDQLNRVMREIRNFIAGLGSDLLKGKDLSIALKQMLDSLTQHHATRVHLAIQDHAAQALSTEQSLHLLLVVQEAVSNCIRHGCAREAAVSLKMLKQGIRLSIRDNGSGFDMGKVKGTGHGLTNIAARAEKIGGRFTLFSKINEGTRVVLDLPKEAFNGRH